MRLKRAIKKSNQHFKVSIKCKRSWFGDHHGGFFVCPSLLSNESIVYSFGIGENISFDSDLIKKFNCNVYGFDPTPKSIKWVKDYRDLPANFHFFTFGIGEKSDIVDFFLPKIPEHVSGSFINQPNVNFDEKVKVEMKCWKDIVNSLRHTQIDVLKMDIEGAEYIVLNQILESQISVGQILIEFHERFFDNGRIKSIEAIEKLKSHGFEIFGVSDTYEEISFINRRLMLSNK